MPGSAVLGSGLVDEMVSLADELRRELQSPSEFATRHWKVEAVRRYWDGGERGEGTVQAISAAALDPHPLVQIPRGRGLENAMDPGGLEEAGEIVLREISLTYLESEIYGTGRVPLTDPTPPTLLVIGGTGSQTLTYAVAGRYYGASDAITAGSFTASIVNGPDTLSPSNYVIVAIPAGSGGEQFDIWRTAGGPSTGKIGTVAGLSISDTGQAGDGSSPPSVNTTPGPLGPDDEFYFRLTDLHGQKTAARHYVPVAPPVPEREGKHAPGWKLRLRRVEVDLDP